MLLAAPCVHVKTYFAGQRQQGISPKARKVEQINAGHPIKLAPHIEATAQPVSVAARLIPRRRLFIDAIGLTAQISGNSRFAFSNLRLIGFIQRNRLGKCKEVFFPIIAYQRLGNGGCGTVTAV